MPPVSRREFVWRGTAGAVVAPFVLAPAPLGAAAVTAQEIVDRIRTAIGVEWKASTVDTFKAGEPTTPITGVVTTSLATIDVLRRAVKAGANMVITSGPTFYSRADTPTPPAGRGDPVFAAKNEFIKANNVVVWRFSDHWQLRTPNPFAQGLTDALGWARYRTTGGDPARLMVPPLTLDALAARVKRALSARGGIRVVGRPQTRVRAVAVLPGTVAIQPVVAVLPNVDVIIAGEIREWESSEYARDVVNAGLGKGLVLIGRSLSEDAGMRVCAEWLRPIVREVPVRWMPAGDPYWRPTA